MKLILRNKAFAFISLSRIFNILGSSIYNIVFVVFASSLPNPKFAVGIANFIVLVPVFFTIFVGMKADQTAHKARTGNSYKFGGRIRRNFNWNEEKLTERKSRASNEFKCRIRIFNCRCQGCSQKSRYLSTEKD